MAKGKHGILDGFNGKLGTVIGYQWKGIECMRSANSYPRDPKTGAQLEQRQLFRTLARLGTEMLQAARIGFRGPADERRTTEYNCFVGSNKQCVAMRDGEVHIDYPALRVAEGGLAGVDFGRPQLDDQLHLSVAYRPEPGSDGADYVLLYAHVPALHQGLLSLPAWRRQHRADMQLPDGWRGLDVHLYGFCWDSDRQASPSTYLGLIQPPVA